MPKQKEPTYQGIYDLLCRIKSPLKPIPVQETNSVVLLRPEDIAFITTAKDGIKIIDNQGRTWDRYDSLKDMERRLEPDKRFYRSHRSYIANVELISAIITEPGGNHRLAFRNLPDDLRADVAESRLPDLRKLLGID